ncbi:DNA polymerase III subunit epsilon [Chryseobacterium taklimakanense]|uniref:DNA polymerase III subunit epsilon n=1 Tax=Chryseobacterium taklimakanense TaxID=536441 RepID=A0A239XIK0_9FLAO|nr:DNA polymerase III subunit epsilon [Chryseobacterium taklimakanense]
MGGSIKPEILKEICIVKMPFGKYKNTVLADLPVSYLEWFVRNGGFPKGKLGMQLSTIYEIKINGLMDLLVPIRKMVIENK